MEWKFVYYKMWVFSPLVFVVCVHAFIEIKPSLVRKKCQLEIKFAIVKWWSIPFTEIKSGNWIMWLQIVHTCGFVIL